MSGTERIIRLVIGVILIAVAALWVGGILGIIFYIVGAILIITGALGFSILYKLLKKGEAGEKPEEESKEVPELKETHEPVEAQ